jgi:hypothetical protein
MQGAAGDCMHAVSLCAHVQGSVQGYARHTHMHMHMLTSSLSVLMVMKGKEIQPSAWAPTWNSSGGSFVNERCSSSRGEALSAAASAPGGEPAAAGTGSTAAATVGCCGWLPAELGVAAGDVVGGEAGAAAGGGGVASAGEPWINLTDPGCSTTAQTQQPHFHASAANACGQTQLQQVPGC